MRSRTSLVLVASVVLVGLGSRARSDEPAENPSSMLRHARVTETVDHDIPKAIDLYRKVFAAAGDTDTTRDAALHLMDLLEARGDRTGALQFARELSDRFVSRLDDAMKRQVHEAMARTLPAGSHAKSPLGDVYVLPAPGSSSNPSPSPLETKIAAILSRLDGVPESDRARAEREVMNALTPVGIDALPILEHALNDSRPERARFSAQALARIGQADAISALAKAVREGDGFTRASAIGGLALIQPSPESSPRFVAEVEPLLALKTLGDRREPLVSAIARHIDAAGLLDRYERGGIESAAWLAAAASVDPVSTAERITKSADAKGVLSPEALSWAGSVGGVRLNGSNDPNQWVPQTPAMASAARQSLLAAVTKGPASTKSIAAASSIAGAFVRTGTASELLEAARTAWIYALDAENQALVTQGVTNLTLYGVVPPLDLLTSTERAPRLEASLTSIYESTSENARAAVSTLYRPSLFVAPVLWASVERLVGSAVTGRPNSSEAALGAVASRLAMNDVLPPPSEDDRWMRASRLDGASDWMLSGNHYWLRRAAARRGDPALLDVVRRTVLREQSPRSNEQASRNQAETWLRDLVLYYRGPDRAAFALDTLVRWGDDGWGVLDWAADDTGFWPLVAKRLGEYDVAHRRALLNALRSVDAARPPPKEFDELWLEELRRPVPSGTPIVRGLVAAAARSGSPRYFATIHELLDKTTDASTDTSYLGSMLDALRDSKTPEARALVIELLSDRKYDRPIQRTDLWDALFGAINAETDPSVYASALDAMARDPLAPGDHFALQRLGSLDRVADLVAIFHEMEKPGMLMRYEYRRQLIAIAASKHLRESVPFLLKEYREGLDSKAAGQALDEIRTFHDRVTSFDGFADGKDPLASEIEAATKGPTVELRRAAVFALAATHGAKAVPALLEIARATNDEPVRAAAIEMIEKIARGTTPAEAPKSASPAPASSAGMPTEPAMDGSKPSR